MAGKILRETEELQDADQSVVVCRGERPFDVQVAKIYIFIVCGGVFYTQIKVRNDSCA
jgi:hypothetical protein